MPKLNTQTKENALEAAANLFKCLCSESRIRILLALFEDPKTVTELAKAADMSQPLVSQHLRHLRDNRLVRASREGRQVYYYVADEHVKHIVEDGIKHTGGC